VAWYGLFVLGGFALLVRSWRVEAHHWLPVIPPMLALVAVGTLPSTSALGDAAYARYDLGEIHDQFVALNLAAALGMTAMALLYDRSRLLLTFATTQASYPAWWAGLWQWGGLPMPDSSEFPGAVPTEIHTITPAPPTEAPTSPEMNVPSFQVIYTCGNQLCLTVPPPRAFCTGDHGGIAPTSTPPREILESP
jgi:hypothetical protein